MHWEILAIGLVIEMILRIEVMWWWSRTYGSRRLSERKPWRIGQSSIQLLFRQSIIFVSPTIMRIDEVSFSPIQHLLHKNSVHE